jgi:hypothetical protein
MRREVDPNVSDADIAELDERVDTTIVQAYNIPKACIKLELYTLRIRSSTEVNFGLAHVLRDFVGQ